MKAKELIELLSSHPEAEVIVMADAPKCDNYGLPIEQGITYVNTEPCFWYKPGIDGQPIIIKAEP